MTTNGAENTCGNKGEISMNEQPTTKASQKKKEEQNEKFTPTLVDD